MKVVLNPSAVHLDEHITPLSLDPQVIQVSTKLSKLGQGNVVVSVKLTFLHFLHVTNPLI